ncbi:MAG TPA: DUF1343 domain-containing protein [Candidatus Sumerlaeota bacterium]|nr:DUF1343 domain-containing protein [Candidatus Sumerlaeota bacterium]HOR26548.1 DUF1343 domain-containing protein [Candidatus Sumerlaeota bacterium]HPK03844.1 DUF1343 domain-containing protein [Candidatus Sumerlaeota bacterium]
MRQPFLIALLAAWLWLGGGSVGAAEILPGVEVLARFYGDRLAGKNVGIVTNPTGVNLDLVSTIDVVRAMPQVRVVRLFAPEHGLRGGLAAGEQVKGGRDPISGLPVISLHGATRKPAPAELEGIDVMLYDIQDVGHRTYTFISTLANVMEVCEDEGIEVMVLDRPEPLGGLHFGGPMLDEEHRSFIGIHDIPQYYGLTPGEFSRLYQRERTPKLKLTVIPMQGWRRGMTYGDLGWIWIPPSEHIPRWETSAFYAMTGTLGELRLVSEGVGTPLPFEQIGAPWIDAAALAEALNAQGLAGVIFRPTTFRPRYGTHNGELCSGVQIHLRDAAAVEPARVSQAILRTLRRLYPERVRFGQPGEQAMFTKALGETAQIRALASGEYAAADEATEKRLADYARRRQAVLIYE